MRGQLLAISLIIVKELFMGNLLYFVVVILIIGWLLGFFVFHVGAIIHVLLVVAVVVVLFRIIDGRKML
jgi:hypothetical protein